MANRHIKKCSIGIPIMAQQKQIQLGTMKLRVRSLALLSGLWIWHCHELWCSLVAIALIRLLAWEPPYAMGVAQKRPKKKKSLTLLIIREMQIKTIIRYYLTSVRMTLIKKSANNCTALRTMSSYL